MSDQSQYVRTYRGRMVANTLWAPDGGEVVDIDAACQIAGEADAVIGDLVEALDKCQMELQNQRAFSPRCGDPEFECVLHDIFSPDDAHHQALEAANAALAKARGDQ